MSPNNTSTPHTTSNKTPETKQRDSFQQPAKHSTNESTRVYNHVPKLIRSVLHFQFYSPLSSFLQRQSFNPSCDCKLQSLPEIDSCKIYSCSTVLPYLNKSLRTLLTQVLITL